MSKVTIRGRIKSIFSAEVNAYLEKNIDPVKMVDMRIRDANEGVRLAKDAHLDMVRLRSEAEMEEKKIQDKCKSIQKELDNDVNLLEKAKKQGLHEKSKVIEDKMRLLLTEQISLEKQAKKARAQKEAYDTSNSKKLVDTAERKCNDLISKKYELSARMRSAQAQGKILDLNKQLDLNDGSSLISEVDRQVRQQEALVKARAELHESSVDYQLQQLDVLVDQDSVESLMKALRTSGGVSATDNSAPLSLSSGSDYDFSSLTLEEAEDLLNETSNKSTRSKIFRKK